MAYRFPINMYFRGFRLFKNPTFKNKSIQFAFISTVKPKKTVLPMKKIALAVSFLGVSGGVYGYLNAAPERKKSFSSELLELSDSYILPEIPDIKPSRQIDGPAKDTGLDFTLYQYQTCPFCCKVRAFLDYYGFPYDVIEVNPVMRQQIKFSKYKKVPILIAHDQKTDTVHQLNDSSVITSILGSFLLNTNSVLPDLLKYYVPVTYDNEDGKKITEVMNQYFLMYGERIQKDKTDDELRNERQWRRWADHELVHILSPNIYRTREEAMQAFNYFSEVGEWEQNFSYFERMLVIYVGASAMYFIGKRLKKKYNLKDDVRESLYDACRLWMKAVGHSKFLGGKSPNLADLAVYGLLSSIEGCMAFKDLLQHTHIGPWYYNVQEAVKTHQGYHQVQSKL